MRRKIKAVETSFTNGFRNSWKTEISLKNQFMFKTKFKALQRQVQDKNQNQTQPQAMCQSIRFGGF